MDYTTKWVSGWHPIRIFLKAAGYRAITMPWRTIYILDEVYQSDIIRHELVHIAQIERMGALKFTAVYLWYLLRYGYDKHPLEIEARETSGIS